MGIDRESENYRIKMQNRLQEENRSPPPPEVTEAERTIAKYHQIQAEIRDQLERLSFDLPHQLACPQCFWRDGRTTKLSAGRSNTKAVRLECEACGFHAEILP